MPLAHAAISGNESSTSSLGSGLINFSDEEFATLKTSYQKLNTEIATKRTKAAALKKRIDAGDTTASQTEYTLLLQDIVDLQARATSLQTLLAQIDLDNAENNNSGGGSSGGSSEDEEEQSGGSMLQQLAGSALQGLFSGQGGMGQALGGLNNLAALNSGNVTTGVTTGSTGSVTPQKNNTKNPGDQTAAPDDKACEDPAAKTPEAKPASTDNSPMRRNAETGSLTATTKLDDSGKPVKTAAKPATKKPDCVGIEYTKKNPGGTAGTGKIESLADAQAYAGQYVCDSSGSNCTRNGQQCASLTKALSGVGAASTWQRGIQVKGNNIAIGTPIATFNFNGNYGPSNAPGGISGGSHTGIYLGQSNAGIQILHQWNRSGGSKITTIPWSSWGKSGREGGNNYYVIANSSSFLGIPWYLPSLLAGLNLIPAQEGLAISPGVPYNEV